jgi:hypothetical protein
MKITVFYEVMPRSFFLETCRRFGKEPTFSLLITFILTLFHLLNIWPRPLRDDCMSLARSQLRFLSSFPYIFGMFLLRCLRLYLEDAGNSFFRNVRHKYYVTEYDT